MLAASSPRPAVALRPAYQEESRPGLVMRRWGVLISTQSGWSAGDSPESWRLPLGFPRCSAFPAPVWAAMPIVQSRRGPVGTCRIGFAARAGAENTEHPRNQSLERPRSGDIGETPCAEKPSEDCARQRPGTATIETRLQRAQWPEMRRSHPEGMPNERGTSNISTGPSRLQRIRRGILAQRQDLCESETRQVYDRTHAWVSHSRHVASLLIMCSHSDTVLRSGQKCAYMSHKPYRQVREEGQVSGGPNTSPKSTL